RAYLLPLFRSIGLSRVITRLTAVPAWQQPLLLLAYSLSDLVKLLRHWFTHRTLLTTDVVAAAELQLLLWSWLSPFYLGWSLGQSLGRSLGRNVALSLVQNLSL
ncbi:MAG: hypothetical protein ACKO7W_22435, partial [Elainella sp.]